MTAGKGHVSCLRYDLSLVDAGSLRLKCIVAEGVADGVQRAVCP